MERAFVCALVECRRETGLQMNHARTLPVRGTARVSEWGGGTVSVWRWCSECTPDRLGCAFLTPGGGGGLCERCNHMSMCYVLVCTEGVRGCTWDGLGVPSRAW